MSGLIPILAIVVVIIGGAIAGITLMSRKVNTGTAKGKEAVLRSASKRLSQNPRDPEALLAMGDIYYKDEAWDKAFKTYDILRNMGKDKGVDEFRANLRYAVAAMKLGITEEAYKSFVIAKGINPNNFEVNFNLGTLEFKRKNYDKAAALLNAARVQDPEHAATLRTLGHAYFRMKKTKEAMTYIRRAIDLAPEDKESLYTLGECYYEAGQPDQALRVFSHLRADPAMGAEACLLAGSINMEYRAYEKAIPDLELGLRHENIRPDIKIDLKYHLAQCYLKMGNVTSALVYLKDIQSTVPVYKDVPVLIARYQELNANKNLQIYLLAPSAEFVALCRKIVMAYFPKAKIKIINVTVTRNDWADITAEVDTPKWTELFIFRFIRIQGQVGEMVIRDFHAHLKEAKAGKGICVSVGMFSDEARRYTEARLIDLIEKDKLSAILNTVDARTAEIQSPPAKNK